MTAAQKPRRDQARTAKAKAAFLQHYSENGVILYACRAASIGRTTFYDWLKKDKRFAGLHAQATEDAIDVLEQEAKRRAVDGWDEPVFQKGRKSARSGSTPTIC